MRERKNTADSGACAPGSIEHQLDMCETGSLRGDETIRRHKDHPNLAMDMAEVDREGDEMSGDDHSSGLQGEASELRGPNHHLQSGVPGDKNEDDEDIAADILGRRSA